jgi:hypothetical protein
MIHQGSFIDGLLRIYLDLSRGRFCRRPAGSGSLGHVYRDKSGGQPVRPFFRLDH